MNDGECGCRYKMTVSYDGTAYSGWQIQPNGPSVQEQIQNALFFLLGDAVHLSGSGRTDAGVHASRQVCHFDAPDFDCPEMLMRLNTVLPETVRILSLDPTTENFHARFSAKSKFYHYIIHLDPVCPPFKSPYCLHLRKKLDLDLLKEAAKKFTGTHDFSSFANSASEGSAAINPVRTIYSINIVPEEGGVRLEFHGNGFLYKMVRNITGALIEVATGKMALEQIDALFAAKDRRKAPSGAPAQGLFLVNVEYD
ncbi:MAG: tRNA pseudouridine(38-40) synthase TruA [Simkaniaceae bacterium]|nr:tRNA pseudouridine(38-40) synthase TruA [Simkaniaceae bacterium]